MLSGKKKVFSKIMVFAVVLTLLLGLWTSSAAGAVTLEPNTKAVLELSREISRSKILLDEEITVTYRIKPNPIPATAVRQPQREIYLVIDTSGSMSFNLAGRTIQARSREKSRLDIVKEAALKFLDNLSGKSGVKVGLITYDDVARIVQSLTTNLNSVKSRVNALEANGGTNIGDGLRRAYYRLTDTRSTNENPIEKYLILLTDGEPTYHSTYRTFPYNFYFEDGNAPHFRGGGSYAWPEDKQYCYDVAERFIKQSGIKSYMIAFTEGSNANVLSEVARKAGGVYKRAVTSDALDRVYEEIYLDIVTDFSVEDVSFEETFPAGVEIVSVPAGFTVNGQKVKGSLGNINYTYNSSSRLYEANPIEFTIRLKGSVSGNYTLNSAKISYKDIDNNTETKNFENKTIEVIALQAPIRVDRTINGDEFLMDEEIVVNYTVTPEEFSIDPGLVPPSELIVKNVSFSEEFPEGLQVVSVSTDALNVAAGKVTGNLRDIVYRYDSTSRKYKASPVNFSITLKGTIGEYIIGEGNSSKVSYFDLDKVTKEKSFPELNARVVKFGQPGLEVVNIVKKGEVVDVTLKITLPKRTRYGELRIPVINDDGSLGKVRSSDTLITTVGGSSDVTVTEHTIRNLSIYKTHRAWLFAESVSGETSETDVITIFEGVNVN